MSLYERTKELDKKKKFLSKTLKRPPSDEELETEGVKDVKHIKKLTIDKEDEHNLELRFRLSV